MSFARKVAAAAAVSMGLALAAPAAFAQFGGIKVPGLGGGSGNSQSNVDVDGLLSQQSNLMKRFGSALGNMRAAEGRTLKALGYKDEAAKAEADAAWLSKGNIDKDAIARISVNSEESLKLTQEAQQKGVALTADGKRELTAAVPHYLSGVGDGSKLPPEFKNWAMSVQSGMSGLSSNPAQAMKLRDGTAVGVYVAQNIPNLVSTWSKTTKNFIDFAKKNEVEVSDLSDKLGKL